MNGVRFHSYALSAFLLVCCILLSGCMENYEMKHQSFIIAIGLDLAEDDQIKMSLLEILFDVNRRQSSEQGGQGSQADHIKIINATCTYFPDCMNRLQNQLSGILNLHQTQYILLGNKILESGVKPYIDFFYHIGQLDQKVKIFATDQEINELLQNDKGKQLNRLIGGAEFHPFVFDVEMWEFAPKNYSPLKSAVISSILIRNNTLNSNGIFLLQEGKLGMKLPVEDALLVQLLIEDRAKEMTLTFQEHNLAYQIRKYRVNMNITPQSVDLYAHTNGWVIDSNEEKTQDTLYDLERIISEEMVSKLKSIIDKAQSAGVDILGIGERFRQKNWDTSNWEERLKELDIEIHVDAKVFSGKGAK